MCSPSFPHISSTCSICGVAICCYTCYFSDLFSKLPQMEKQLRTCRSFSAMGGKPRVSTLSCDDFFQKATTIPSGKLTVCYGKSPCLMEKSTINGTFSIAFCMTRGYSGTRKSSHPFGVRPYTDETC